MHITYVLDYLIQSNPSKFVIIGSICQKCVLRWDHHCPWVNNCVGFLNYKFFLLKLFWSGLAIVLAIILFSTKYAFVGWNGPNALEIQILVCLFLLIPFGLFVVPLFGSHMYLLLSNQTTLESQVRSQMVKKQVRKFDTQVLIDQVQRF